MRDQIQAVTSELSAFIPRFTETCLHSTPAEILAGLKDIAAFIAETVPEILPDCSPGELTDVELIRVNEWVSNNVGKGTPLSAYPALIQLGRNPLLPVR